MLKDVRRNRNPNLSTEITEVAEFDFSEFSVISGATSDTSFIYKFSRT
jgi:hypothetical protein